MITVRAKGVKKFILTLYSLINLHNASIVKTCIQACSQLEEKRWREEKRREEKRRDGRLHFHESGSAKLMETCFL